MNNERNTFHEMNLHQKKRNDYLTDLTGSNTNFHQYTPTMMNNRGNQVYGSYDQNLHKSDIQNRKTSTGHEEQVSSTVKIFTPNVATPFILPPPKVVGPDTKSFKKKQKISNKQLKKSTERPPSDEENQLNSFVQDHESMKEVNDQGISPQTDTSGKNEIFHEENTEIIKENVLNEQKSNEILSGDESLSEELEFSIENSIDDEFASVKDESDSIKEEEPKTVPEDQLTNSEITIEVKNTVENQGNSISEQDSTILKEQINYKYPVEHHGLADKETNSFDEIDFPIDKDIEKKSFSANESQSEDVQDSIIKESMQKLLEESSSSLEESSSLQDESSFSQDESFSWQEESSFSQVESFFLQEENSSSQEEASSLHDEITSTQEEACSLQEKISSTQKESSSLTDESSSSQDISLSFYEKISSMLEESSSIQDCSEEERMENCQHNLQNPSLISVLPKKDPLPIVKLPVLLANMEIDIEVFDSFELFFPLTKITKIDWSIHSLDIRVLLPSNTIFITGVLIADIEYVSENSTHSFHTSKIQIPWQKTTNVHWIYPPLIACSSNEKYLFDNGNESNTHRQFHEQFADHIQHHLHSINFIWHEEVNFQDNTPKLFIQGRANLSIDLLQPQYIHLNHM